MGGGLRFASVDDMPESMRAKITQLVPKVKRRRRDEEHEEQVMLFDELERLVAKDRRYQMAFDRTFAIPNGGGRSKREGGRLKAEGVKPGVADIFVSLPAGSYHGLYIEMKSQTGGVSDDQRKFLLTSRNLDYRAEVCRSWREAFTTWKAYVDLRI